MQNFERLSAKITIFKLADVIPREMLDEPFIHLYFYYIFHFLRYDAAGAAAPGCSDTVNAGD